jgi:hypothetical protein
VRIVYLGVKNNAYERELQIARNMNLIYMQSWKGITLGRMYMTYKF